MSDGDATRRARWTRPRSARHDTPDNGGSAAPHGPLVRRGTPPPLLFQVDTVDPWQDSHPGESLHSGARHEIDAAFERALGPAFDPIAVALQDSRTAEVAAPEAPVEEVVETPVVETPVVEPAVEPAVDELPEVVPPVADEPAAVIEPPVVEPPVEEPAVEEPVVEEPVLEPAAAAEEPVLEAPVDQTVVELPHTTPDTSANETTIVIPPIEGTVPAPAMYVPPTPATEPLILDPPGFPLEPPVYVPPVASAPIVLEPPMWQPPTHEPVSIEAPFEPPDDAPPPVDEVPTFWSPPAELPPVDTVPPPVDDAPTFWSPPVAALDSAPVLDQPYLEGPPLIPVDPTPRFFTREGVPSAPVSLSKDAAHDPWLVALQPEAPPFSAEALLAEPIPAPEAPEAPPTQPGWFDGRLDPFEFGTQFGTPAEQWRDGATGDDTDGLGGIGRHRVEGEPVPTRRGRRAAKEAKEVRKAPWWELPALIVLAIVIAIVVKTFVVQPFYIPSPSMEKTLHGCTGCSGDRILVNKPIYDFRDPEPGDIVVFNAPPGWNEEKGTSPPSNPILRVGRGFLQLVGFVPPDGLVLVKRVIAVAGQTVKGESVNGTDVVMVSNHGNAGPWRTLTEKYVYLDGTDQMGNFGPVTVPKGHLWVMGDHRNDSADSRYHCGSKLGTSGETVCDPNTSTVPIKDVIGKAFVIAWPVSRWRTLGTPSTFAGGIVLPLFFIRRRRRRRRRA